MQFVNSNVETGISRKPTLRVSGKLHPYRSEQLRRRPSPNLEGREPLVLPIKKHRTRGVAAIAIGICL
jgi:hypothetical protein